jgi:hypothetical protein
LRRYNVELLRRRARPPPGRAVQVDPIKPTLKPSGAKRLTLKYDEPLSTFAFKSKLRRCIQDFPADSPYFRDYFKTLKVGR